MMFENIYGLGLNGFNFSTGFFALIVLLAAWELVWKLFGMWKAARKNSPIWFVAMGIFNTAGILPILYLFVCSKMKTGKRNKRR